MSKRYMQAVERYCITVTTMLNCGGDLKCAALLIEDAADALQCRAEESFWIDTVWN